MTLNRFSATVVAVVALAIGANVAVFAVVNTVLLKPIGEGLVVFLSSNKSGSNAFASDIKYELWREQSSVVEDVSGYYTRIVTVTGIDQPQRATGSWVTTDYFRLFGLGMELGRGFTEEEERPNGPRVAVLGNGFWKRTFGGDRNIVGKVIRLSDDSYQVTGVLAEDKSVEGDPPDVWLPFQIDPKSNNQVHYFFAAAHLKPGVSLEQANAQLKLATEEFRRRYPNSLSTGRGDVYSVQPLRDYEVRDVRASLYMLAGAVSLVLLIACANVANLLLIRGTARSREMAIRLAIGASRGRIIRQLLRESLTLSGIGAVIGLGLGMAGIRALLSLNAVNIPRLGDKGANVAMDWRIFAFTALAAVATAILFGLAPALHASRTDLSSRLRGRGLSGGGSKGRSALAVSEMSLAIVLLIGAALFIRTLIALRAVNPGFDPQQVEATFVNFEPKLAKARGVDQMAEDALRRVGDLPGVESAALTGLLPLEGNFNSLTIVIIGRPLEGLSHGNSRWMIVSPGYFHVLKIPLLRGRLFTDGDKRDAAPVAIINAAMARAFWPGGDALNERLVIGRGLGQNFEEPERQVVGIVGDVHDDSLGRSPEPAVFVPLAQRPNRATATWVVVRTRGESRALDRPIRSELSKATGGLPVPALRSMQEILVKSTARQEFQMLLLTIFGGLALVLAAIGVYGLMAYYVEQRTQEMGIRMALGAQAGEVRNMVVLQGLRLAGAGAAIGIAAAIGLTRLIARFLFGVEMLDPFVFTAVPVLMIGVAVAAVWLPALRASRVDPMTALRHE